MKFLTLLEAVALHAKNTPDKLCLIDANNHKTMTYGEFWKAVQVFATKLKAFGLRKGERVVVRVGSLLETFTAQFGIHLAGGVYCPVERNLKDLRMLEMLNYLESNFLISTEEISFDGKYVNLLSVLDGAVSDDSDLVFPDPEDLAIIIFTTGTTGKAKGVMLNHKSGCYHAQKYISILGTTDKDCFLWTSPIDKLLGARAFCSTFYVGGTAVYYNGIVFAKKYFEALKCYEASLLVTTPYELATILNADEDAFLSCAGHVRAVLIGGSALPEVQKRRLKSILPKAKTFLVYASTETAVVSYYDFGVYPNKENCVGKAIGDTDIRIIDVNGDKILDSTRDNPGIIACKSNARMMGYWGAPDLTDSVLKNGYIVMADMGYMDNEGFLYVLGRRDDVIITGSHKVAPYEIENVVMEMPGIFGCACVAAKNEILGNTIKLFVVMKDGCEFSDKEILSFLRQRLEIFKLPHVIYQLESLPKVGNSSKIDRRALKEYE